MQRSICIKRFPAVIAAVFFAVSAAPASMAQTQDGPQGNGAAISLPSYFQDILGRRDIEVGCTAKRDDLGIEIAAAPADVMDYAELISNLSLKASQGGALAVKAPFTLRFSYGKQTDVFSFSAKGVGYNGGAYLPENPAALESFYDEDREKFFSAEYARLGKHLNITAGEVAAVDLNRSHYDDDISMHLTSKDAIAALLDEQKEILVRAIQDGEEIQIGMGGSADETAYTLNDGSVVRVADNGGMLSLQKGAQAQAVFQILRSANMRSANGRAQFDKLMESYDAVPKLSVALGGTQAGKVYQASFQYGGESKSYKNAVPMDFGFDKHVYLPIRSTNAAKLSFSLDASQVTAKIFRADKGKEGALQQPIKEAAGQQIAVSSDGSIALPGEPGAYYATIHAVFPKGTAGYFFGFTVSDLPEFFDSIEYGNNEGDVALTRDDIARSVTCGQNRQYVAFLESLDLVPYSDAGTVEASKIQKPFTLTFRCEGYNDQIFQFSTSDSKILYNGKPYRARNMQAFEKLYAASDPMSGDTLLDDTKGFLTAELATFRDLYPLQSEQIASIKEEEKRLYRRSVSRDDAGNTTYGFTLDDVSSRQVEPSAFASVLKGIQNTLLAKEGKDADAYGYGTYTAYELLLKDGRRFTLDRRLIIDGKESGYYIIPDTKHPA